MRKHLTVLSALLLSLAFVGAGCSSTSSSPSTTGSSGGGGTTTVAPTGSSAPGPSGSAASGAITVSAAASLTDPFKKIGDDFKKANPAVDVKFNLASSATLSKQIIDGGAADGFASADQANMDKLAAPGLLAGPPTVFAHNQLAIVVKKGNPKNVKTLADLAAVATVSLCGTDVPCGKYADQILKAANITIPTDKVTRGQDVKATLAAVSEGDADAGIVYVTDVTGDKAQSVVIPGAQNAIATYPIGIVKASKNQATTKAFIDYVMSAPGQATLRAAGFLPPT